MTDKRDDLIHNELGQYHIHVICWLHSRAAQVSTDNDCFLVVFDEKDRIVSILAGWYDYSRPFRNMTSAEYSRSLGRKRIDD